MKDDNNIPNKIYINLEHKEKLLVLKLDWFDMHGGRRKCKCAKPKHITGECYTNQTRFYHYHGPRKCGG
jgi:hypothetical protein